ncbi:hypothetical protein JQS43_00530 [Natronosporangium hydrolyticum]|uniref:Uncharacterized protein n=1 Tax=Natronosporangium hydrolyticum TaxID=2811111 RepID=A0A895YAZ6_9ACTN|nr:hypothetical protein [Natronosporangium hydrolyticum]QSB14917.1 hypothetical protein JQS43_00530 [Natronosporangium hydrolyticum]
MPNAPNLDSAATACRLAHFKGAARGWDAAGSAWVADLLISENHQMAIWAIHLGPG